MIRAYSESMVSSNTESCVYMSSCSRCLQLCLSGLVMWSFALLQNEKWILDKDYLLKYIFLCSLTLSFSLPELHFNLPRCGTRDNEDFIHVPSEHTARICYIHGCLCSGERRKILLSTLAFAIHICNLHFTMSSRVSLSKTYLQNHIVTC